MAHTAARNGRLRRAAAGVLLALAAVPLLWTAWEALGTGSNSAAWRSLAQDPALRHAVLLTLWTGLASTLLAWWGAAALLARGFVRQRLARLLSGLPVMLATPHAALAIGLLFLLAPSGWLLRALSPWLTGFDSPPPWPTTQDPWGLGLIAALVIKEIPFLLWTAATQLQRDDVRQRWRAEHALAQTLGYAPRRAFWLVLWPQLAGRLRWPLLAVLAYGLTVVDMALVIGPASPPTLAVLAWQWLQDADPATYAQGAAAGLLLALLVLSCSMAWLAAQRLRRRLLAHGHGVRGEPARSHGSDLGLWLLMGVYAAVLLALAVGSISGVWAFPSVWPQSFTAAAWEQVAQSSGTVVTTLWLAVGSSAIALAWSVAWLELAPRRWDDTLRPLLYLPLVLPAVLWVVGLYGVGLQLRLEGRASGLLIAHTLMVLPYVLLALGPAYLGFDVRYAQLNASLGRSPWAFLLRVKWPLLKRSLASAAAVGFAVSVAQYLPTLYLGAGRFSSVTTEAVTLASGGQRSLTSAYAGLQLALPVLAFAMASWLGRPRRFRHTTA
ncbi:MAG: ABC transporter permease [Hydrogenophaga sp.]|uniref:ABC transporter permease n=1 Tax=Hydrogenophaga sp. TaxID=1904254 RepID=UPI0026171D59|nr:ABC transporter permease [Hydrogenophaga sp.]MDM7942286.1 ABC transporter permease [Hydrogenophaga sp.]